MPVDGNGPGAGGLAARFLAAFVLVFATYNPAGWSFFDWAIKPVFSGTLPEGASLPARLLVALILAIAWVVFLQATKRALGLAGTVLVAGVFVCVAWLLAEWDVVRAAGQGLAWIALVVVASVLAVGVSWSHFTRRLTGQVDTDAVG